MAEAYPRSKRVGDDGGCAARPLRILLLPAEAQLADHGAGVEVERRELLLGGLSSVAAPSHGETEMPETDNPFADVLSRPDGETAQRPPEVARSVSV